MTDYTLAITTPGQPPAHRTVTADEPGDLAQAVHHHARGLLGGSRIDIRLDGLTGAITSHGAHVGTVVLTAVGPPPRTVASTSPDGIRYGWTLRTLDALARAVVSNNRAWWPAGDREDLYAAAWHGIVEHLYTTDTEPRRSELMEAGRRALADDVRDAMRHHGARRDGTNSGLKYAMYWEWAGRATPSPENRIIERTALEQILVTLTPRQRQAFDALAATGDYAEAAQLLDIEHQTFRSLLGRGRGAFRALWHEGELPSKSWGCDRRAGSTADQLSSGDSAVNRIRRRARDRQAAA